ncbi:hypothetical protein ACHAO4_007561 [Trichoderma viride]
MRQNSFTAFAKQCRGGNINQLDHSTVTLDDVDCMNTVGGAAYTVISRDERTVSLIISATEDMTNRTRIQDQPCKPRGAGIVDSVSSASITSQLERNTLAMESLFVILDPIHFQRGRGRGGRGGGQRGGQAGTNVRGRGGGRGDSDSTGIRRDGSNAVPALDQLEGQAGETVPVRKRFRAGVFRTPGLIGRGIDGTLTRREAEAVELLRMPLEEDLPPQEEQQQQQQSEVVAMLAAMQRQIQQQQQIAVLVGREWAREQQTRENDDELSNRMEGMRGLWVGASDKDDDNDDEGWREGEMVVAKKSAKKAQK